MSRASTLQAIEWSPESSWAESSSSFSYRLLANGAVDLSGLTHPRTPIGRTVQYRNDYGGTFLGPQGGSFSITLPLTGHGSSTSGSITVPTDLARFLSYVIGNTAASSSAGTTISDNLSTATALNTTAASGFSAGSIFWCGALGDGEAEGQAGVVSSHSGSVLTSLVALPAAPVSGAVVATGEMIYPTETPTSDASMTGLRMRFLSANLGFDVFGAFAQSLTWSFPFGGQPTVTVQMGVSRWADIATALPSAVSPQTYSPAPVSAGSFFINSRGTATRVTKNVRSVTLTHTLGVVPVQAPGGVGQYQTIVGAHRTPDEVILEYVVDAGDASTTPTETVAFDADTDQHVLFNLNGAAAGKRVALYLPNACHIDERPTQMDMDGLNRVRKRLRAKVGPTTTNDLTLSAYRICLG